MLGRHMSNIMPINPIQLNWIEVNRGTQIEMGEEGHRERVKQRNGKLGVVENDNDDSG